MGFFTALFPKPQVRISIPSMRELIYPGELKSFYTLKANEHKDARALITALYRLNYKRKKWAFTEDDIDCRDFNDDTRAAFDALQKRGIIKELEEAEIMTELYSRDGLVNIARKWGVTIGGKKQEIAERLLKNGYKFDRRKYKKRLFNVTEEGIKAIDQYFEDEKQTIIKAINALKEMDFNSAVMVYREFDDKWGYIHPSGKKHTIFAHYDIDYKRFEFIVRYPMREIRNSDNFKKTLRGCMIAGLMRGETDKFALRKDFESVCDEYLDYPRLLYQFDCDIEVLRAMQRNIDYDKGCATEYYISRIDYLARHC